MLQWGTKWDAAFEFAVGDGAGRLDALQRVLIHGLPATKNFYRLKLPLQRCSVLWGRRMHGHSKCQVLFIQVHQTVKNQTVQIVSLLRSVPLHHFLTGFRWSLSPLSQTAQNGDKKRVVRLLLLWLQVIEGNADQLANQAPKLYGLHRLARIWSIQEKHPQGPQKFYWHDYE